MVVQRPRKRAVESEEKAGSHFRPGPHNLVHTKIQQCDVRRQIIYASFFQITTARRTSKRCALKTVTFFCSWFGKMGRGKKLSVSTWSSRRTCMGSNLCIPDSLQMKACFSSLSATACRPTGRPCTHPLRATHAEEGHAKAHTGSWIQTCMTAFIPPKFSGVTSGWDAPWPPFKVRSVVSTAI